MLVLGKRSSLQDLSNHFVRLVTEMFRFPNTGSVAEDEGEPFGPAYGVTWSSRLCNDLLSVEESD